MFNAPRSDLQIQVQQQLGRLLPNLIFAWKIDVPDRYHLELAHKWIVQLYQTWGKPDKAAEWKKR
jgi:hypothetical protein